MQSGHFFLIVVFPDLSAQQGIYRAMGAQVWKGTRAALEVMVLRQGSLSLRPSFVPLLLSRGKISTPLIKLVLQQYKGAFFWLGGADRSQLFYISYLCVGRLTALSLLLQSFTRPLIEQNRRAHVTFRTNPEMFCSTSLLPLSLALSLGDLLASGVPGGTEFPSMSGSCLAECDFEFWKYKAGAPDLLFSTILYF